MKLSELKIVQTALPLGTAARQIVDRAVNEIEAKADLGRRTWNAYCSHYGLTPADFGATFAIKGTQYQITGLNPGAPRFAIECKRVRDGKPFRVPATAVSIRRIAA